MQKKIYLTVSFLFLFLINFSQNNLPYPVIFVHGLVGSDETFDETMCYLRDHDALGPINVFDVVLNADNDTEEALMSEDVKWEDFEFGPWYDRRDIYAGRRNYEEDVDDYSFYWSPSNIFAINFKEERIKGAAGTLSDYFDYSDQAAIFKQGYALNKMIKEVLDYTGAEKVVLVGHSMGGLCIREYLQRTNSSGLHVNWIDPYSPDGHKVARVATYGTPHLGSNAGFDPSKNYKDTLNKSLLPDENTEANRDLLWEYDDTNCSGLKQGIYMFGGNEACIDGDFDNRDINCDGDEYDDITGINESYYSKDYNPDMPLPLNIKYTYMTSVWATWDGVSGDGAVDINRQWLHNESDLPTPLGLTDTTLSDIVHTDEASDYKNIIRGIDEPKRFDLAYKLKFNRPVIGYITFQQDLQTADDDVFKVDASGLHTVAITIDGALSGVHTIGFYDASENMLCSRPVSTFPDKLYVNVPEGTDEIFIKISGTASPETWKNPYTLNVLSGSWEGDVSSDWDNGENWIVGTPDSYDDVYIEETALNMPEINSDAHCNRANIPAGSNITITPEASIEFHNDMILDGKIILKSDFVNTASYLDNGTITGNGTVVLERNLKSGGYHYLSSHVSNGNSDAFTVLDNGYTNPNFYFYDETNDNPDWLYGWTRASGIMQPAKGYACYGPYEQTLFISEGKPNTGDININITNSNFGITSDGWNLIGNPYPSAISAYDFLMLNRSGDIDGTVYLWDDDYTQSYSTEDYGAFNLSGYLSGTGGGKYFNGFIAPGQGFFVKAERNGTVIFNNSVRSNYNSIFFKNKQEDNIKRLFVNLSGNGLNNKILLAFTDNATEDFDLFYDAIKIKTNPDFAFYSVLEDKDLIIEALPDFHDNDYKIPLGTDIAVSGIYTFKFDSIENIPKDVDIFFEDNISGEYIDVRKKNIFEKFIDSGTEKNRFSVIFAKNSTSIEETEISDFKVFSSGKTVFIQSGAYGTYHVYNINGQIIKEGIFNEGYKSINMNEYPSGIYLFGIISGNNNLTFKILLQDN